MSRGCVLLIGGSEESPPRCDIFASFLDLCGGPGANLLIFAAASRFEREAQNHADLLLELGAAKVRLIYIEKRSDGENPDYLHDMEQAHGVLLTSCNHLRLTTNLGGTPLARALRRRNSEGLHVAGIGAGASYICGHMITYGQVGVTPRAGQVTLTPGMGLINSVIVDPQIHRQGLGRLLAAIAYNPFAVGVGLESAGAVLIDDGYDLHVIGSGPVTIIDPSELENSSIDEAKNEEAFSMIGLKLHLLTPGNIFNIKTRDVQIESESLRTPITGRPVSWIG